MGFKDFAMAMAAVKARLAERARGEFTLTISMTGRPTVTVEANLTLTNLRDGVTGDWLVTKVVHTVEPTAYRCSIEAEKPNSDPDVVDATDGPVNDIVSPK